jgi:hypothetical protein
MAARAAGDSGLLANGAGATRLDDGFSGSNSDALSRADVGDSLPFGPGVVALALAERSGVTAVMLVIELALQRHQRSM